MCCVKAFTRSASMLQIGWLLVRTLGTNPLNLLPSFFRVVAWVQQLLHVSSAQRLYLSPTH
jgi:hypothetical protein